MFDGGGRAEGRNKVKAALMSMPDNSTRCKNTSMYLCQYEYSLCKYVFLNHVMKGWNFCFEIKMHFRKVFGVFFSSLLSIEIKYNFPDAKHNRKVEHFHISFISVFFSMDHTY